MDLRAIKWDFILEIKSRIMIFGVIILRLSVISLFSCFIYLYFLFTKILTDPVGITYIFKCLSFNYILFFNMYVFYLLNNKNEKKNTYHNFLTLVSTSIEHSLLFCLTIFYYLNRNKKVGIFS